MPSVTTVLSATETEKSKQVQGLGNKTIQVHLKKPQHEDLRYTWVAKIIFAV